MIHFPKKEKSELVEVCYCDSTGCRLDRKSISSKLAIPVGWHLLTSILTCFHWYEIPTRSIWCHCTTRLVYVTTNTVAVHHVKRDKRIVTCGSLIPKLNNLLASVLSHKMEEILAWKTHQHIFPKRDPK
mmetsp:Transcript_14779/g.22561  ORF Transcript_14779/g.22561 Transcript_14779/m.22561 type:complete len:129 (+) Transcript_14779:284-670(+)